MFLNQKEIKMDKLKNAKQGLWREAITNDWTSGVGPAYLRQLGEY